MGGDAEIALRDLLSEEKKIDKLSVGKMMASRAKRRVWRHTQI